MLKLVKYEFRRAAAAFFSLLGVAAALEAYFLISLNRGEEDHVLISLMLLFLCASALTLFTLIRGVTSYSSELGQKSSYLIFMTPHSHLKIVASKFLYTFLNGLFFAALISGVFALDFRLTMDYYGEWESFLEGLRVILTEMGVPVSRFLGAAAFGVGYAFLQILSEIALAYVAITISYTLFRDRKWRWLPSLILFGLLSWLVSWVCGQFPTPMEELVLIDETLTSMNYGVEAQVSTDDSIRHLLPTALVSLGVILASMFGCAAMLKRKVSL